jgi:hypothetical protein
VGPFLFPIWGVGPKKNELLIKKNESQIIPKKGSNLVGFSLLNLENYD